MWEIKAALREGISIETGVNLTATWDDPAFSFSEYTTLDNKIL